MILLAVVACKPATVENTVKGKWYGTTVMEDDRFAEITKDMQPHEVEHMKTVLKTETCELDLKGDGTYNMFGKWLLSEEGEWRVEAGQVMLTPTMKMYSTSYNAVMEEVVDPVTYSVVIDEGEVLSSSYLTRRSKSRIVFTREKTE